MENRLLELRKRHGIGQEELARLTGLSRNTVYLIEHNKREPSPRTVKALSNFFGVSRAYLLGYSDGGDDPGREGEVPQLLRRLEKLSGEDRRLLLRGVWPAWTSDAEADVRSMALAIDFQRTTRATGDELRRLLISLEPSQARRLLGEEQEHREQVRAFWLRLLFEAVSEGEVTPEEAARKAEKFGAAA